MTQPGGKGLPEPKDSKPPKWFNVVCGICTGVCFLFLIMLVIIGFSMGVGYGFSLGVFYFKTLVGGI